MQPLIGLRKCGLVGGQLGHLRLKLIDCLESGIAAGGQLGQRRALRGFAFSLEPGDLGGQVGCGLVGGRCPPLELLSPRLGRLLMAQNTYILPPGLGDPLVFP